MSETRDRLLQVEYAVVVAGVVIAIALGWRWMRRDVDFCRGLFNDLVNGRPAAEQRIDWEHLNALGVDIGQEYQAFRLEKDRVDYRREFVGSFAKGFASAGAKAGAFAKWRVAKRDDDTVTVAVDAGKNKTLLFLVPAHGTKQLLGLQWEQPAGACPTCGS